MCLLSLSPDVCVCVCVLSLSPDVWVWVCTCQEGGLTVKLSCAFFLQKGASSRTCFLFHGNIQSILLTIACLPRQLCTQLHVGAGVCVCV